MKFKELLDCDYKRYGGNVPSYQKKFLYWFRRAQTSRGILKSISRFVYRVLADKHGIEISSQQAIGKGFYIGHPYNITINPSVRIGENCNIHKGVLIWQENRGSRKGTPIIGDRVWIGVNSVIVGNINIGDDVLIAPNSYVNCDVPTHSIVLGNPCIIKTKERATEGYINHIV